MLVSYNLRCHIASRWLDGTEWGRDHRGHRYGGHGGYQWCETRRGGMIRCRWDGKRWWGASRWSSEGIVRMRWPKEMPTRGVGPSQPPLTWLCSSPRGGTSPSGSAPPPPPCRFGPPSPAAGPAGSTARTMTRRIGRTSFELREKGMAGYMAMDFLLCCQWWVMQIKSEVKKRVNVKLWVVVMIRWGRGGVSLGWRRVDTLRVMLSFRVLCFRVCTSLALNIVHCPVIWTLN